ncbi:MAG: ABC transporter permease [Planctomycetota bacterium]|jgi:ABC-type lipoprotein release transport system permease subunit
MRLPLRYSIRNLTRRKVRTFLTMLSMALVVSVSVVMFAFAMGMLHSVKSSGEADNLIIMDRKAASQAFSKVTTQDLNLLKGLPQIKKNAAGEPLLSPEYIQQSRVTTENFENRPGTMRGIGSNFFEVNKMVKIIDGEGPTSGNNVAVGALTHTSIGVPREDLAIGKELTLKGEKWTVVGHFEANGSAIDSEFLADLKDIERVYKRSSFSAVTLKIDKAGDVPLLTQSLNSRMDIQVKAVPEQEYYRGLSEGFERVIFLAVLLAVIAMTGGLVSGMNTMYASVLGRVREIGTLKTLGFSPGSIIKSFLVESVLIAVLGGVIGCAVAWQINGLQAKVAQGAMQLHINNQALIVGMSVAVLIGIMGALIPARKGANMKIPDALAAL